MLRSCRIIAATGFVRLPVEPQRRRSAVSLAPYSPPLDGPQTPPRCKRSRPTRRAVGDALHLLPHGSAAVDAVGIKLDPHRLRVEVIRDRPRTSNTCCSRVGLDLHLAEAQRAPFLFQTACCQSTICLPIAPLFGSARHGRRPQPGGSVARCIRAPCGWRRSAASTAPCFPASAPTQAVGMPFSSRV